MHTSSINQKILMAFLTLLCFSINPIAIEAQNSVKIKTKNGKRTISINTITSDLSIEYDGEITITDDDKDVKSISKGGYIEIKKSSFGRRRRIIIENDGGELVRKFYVGWSEKDYYPDGKEWLEDIMPDILKSTTIAAKSRVDRFYKKGGVDAVLSEIKNMDSDYIQSHYFKLLIDKDLNTNEIVKTIKTAGRTINSDHYLSNILKTNQQLFLKNPETINAYIDAAKNVNSDHYLTQILKRTISDRGISDAQLGKLLQISESVNSDHYLTEILKQIMDKRELNAKNMEQVMRLSKSINSDHYKSTVLKKALKSNNLSQQAYDTFLSSLQDINSDHYASAVINELMKTNLDTKNLTHVLGIIQKNIGSDSYSSRIYKSLAKRNDLTDDQLIVVLIAAKTMNSDSYLSQTLLAFAPRVKKGSQKLKEAYTKTAKSINSETYFGRAIKAIY